jgi:uncharacterized protein (TIGR04255 family)
MTKKLPEYDHPPLNEVSIGVQFQQLKNLHSANLGLYWGTIKELFPLSEDQLALAHAVEQEALQPVASVAEIRPLTFPFIRSWFLSREKTELLQVQADRFHRNWRRIVGDETYPRFQNLLQDFEREWQGFVQFLGRNEIGEPIIDQCELTYVNHIAKETSHLSKVFPSLAPHASKGFLPHPEVINWAARYKLPDNRGRLHAEINPAIRQIDPKPILVFSLTARGEPKGKSENDIQGWFELAHEWIVKAFDELTGPEMHKEWGKR